LVSLPEALLRLATPRRPDAREAEPEQHRRTRFGNVAARDIRAKGDVVERDLVGDTAESYRPGGSREQHTHQGERVELRAMPRA